MYTRLLANRVHGGVCATTTHVPCDPACWAGVPDGGSGNTRVAATLFLHNHQVSSRQPAGLTYSIQKLPLDYNPCIEPANAVCLFAHDGNYTVKVWEVSCRTMSLFVQLPTIPSETFIQILRREKLGVGYVYSCARMAAKSLALIHRTGYRLPKTVTSSSNASAMALYCVPSRRVLIVT